MNVTL
jgi:hypothetical protein